MITKEKVLWLAVGLVGGGVAGYLVGELVVDQIMFGDLDEIKNEEDDGVAWKGEAYAEKRESFVPDKPGMEPKVDYAAKNKSKLEDLVTKYKVPDDPFRIISQEEWDSKHPVMDKITVTYYEADNTYCGEDEELIAAPQDLFGPNAHLHFGEMSDDPELVYIRNFATATDYEIILNTGSYKELVLGELPEEKPPKRKYTRRAKKSEPAEEVEPDDEANDEDEK